MPRTAAWRRGRRSADRHQGARSGRSGTTSSRVCSVDRQPRSPSWMRSCLQASGVPLPRGRSGSRGASRWGSALGHHCSEITVLRCSGRYISTARESCFPPPEGAPTAGGAIDSMARTKSEQAFAGKGATYRQRSRGHSRPCREDPRNLRANRRPAWCNLRTQRRQPRPLRWSASGRGPPCQIPCFKTSGGRVGPLASALSTTEPGLGILYDFVALGSRNVTGNAGLWIAMRHHGPRRASSVRNGAIELPICSQ
jgi:hypothetical protein